MDYYGNYTGFNDNGNEAEQDWHGYTKNKFPENILGSSEGTPFSFTWNTDMLPAQMM